MRGLGYLNVRPEPAKGTRDVSYLDVATAIAATKTRDELVEALRKLAPGLK